MRALIVAFAVLCVACAAELPVSETPSEVGVASNGPVAQGAQQAPSVQLPVCPSGQTIHASGGCTSLVTGVPVSACNFWCE